LMFLALDVVLFALWGGLDAPTLRRKPWFEGGAANATTDYLACGQDLTLLWQLTVMLPKFILLGVTSVLAFKVRDVVHAFGESRFIGLVLYNLLFISVLCILLLNTLSDPLVALGISTLGVWYSLAASVGLVVVPKMLILVGAQRARRAQMKLLKEIQPQHQKQHHTGTLAAGKTTGHTHAHGRTKANAKGGGGGGAERPPYVGVVTSPVTLNAQGVPQPAGDSNRTRLSQSTPGASDLLQLPVAQQGHRLTYAYPPGGNQAQHRAGSGGGGGGVGPVDSDYYSNYGHRDLGALQHSEVGLSDADTAVVGGAAGPNGTNALVVRDEVNAALGTPIGGSIDPRTPRQPAKQQPQQQAHQVKHGGAAAASTPVLTSPQQAVSTPVHQAGGAGVTPHGHSASTDHSNPSTGSGSSSASAGGGAQPHSASASALAQAAASTSSAVGSSSVSASPQHAGVGQGHEGKECSPLAPVPQHHGVGGGGNALLAPVVAPLEGSSSPRLSAGAPLVASPSDGVATLGLSGSKHITATAATVAQWAYAQRAAEVASSEQIVLLHLEALSPAPPQSEQ